ncbi:glycosyl hydrolase [Bacteroidota bacterium]
MDISRRNFIRIGSLATISSPFLINGCTSNEKQDNQTADLYKLFKDPPNSARPFVRWWWNGDMLTEKEILRELDLLNEAGIGGVEINPIRFPKGSDPVGYEPLEWLSDEWIKMLEVTLVSAKKRDIICDIIVGSGWPFGGEFLEKDEQTQLLTFETIDLTGPGSFSFSKEELLEKVDPGIHSKNEKIYREIHGLRLVPAEIDTFDPGIDLNDKLNKDQIIIDVPDGNHVLYYLVKLTGFQAVINGAPGAAGPVLNHYNKVAVDKYLYRMSDRLKPVIGDLGDHFRAMFCDSLEMEGANWYDDLPVEFEKRRGYDLLPYLPFILFKIGHMGNPVEEIYGSQLSPEVELEIQRVRYDFYITRLELFKERFIDSFNDWCHQNNVKSRIQAYGRGYHPLEASMSIDIPECETWLRETVGTEFADTGWRGRAYSVINKFVASGARLSGNRLVSCEEITNTSMVCNATLETIKVTGDQSNLSGVTHSVLHGFNYSPPDAPFPGWVQYGTFFNERNPWWPYLRLWTDYKARLSSVFMNTDPVADIAILHPLADMWMKFGLQRDPFPVVSYPEYQHNIWEAIQQNGFGCDYVSENILQGSSFENGKFQYGPRSYLTLILLEVETILPQTAIALNEFAEAGGKIIFIGKTPFQNPEFKDHASKDATVKSTIDKIIGNYPSHAGIHPAPSGSLIEWFRAIMDRFSLKSYLNIENPDLFINQNLFRSGDSEFLFISNSDARKSRKIKIKIDNQGKTAWIWNAETGERKRMQVDSSNGEIHLSFEPAGSKLIVFDTNKNGTLLKSDKIDLSQSEPIPGPWNVILDHIDGSSDKLKLDTLVDFVEDERLKTFAGVARYEKTLELSGSDIITYIDLGGVKGVSEVIINGKSLGIKWYGFHRFPINDALISGENKIEIRITTVMGNYLKTLKDNPVTKNWVIWQKDQSMGLIGPVTLL